MSRKKAGLLADRLKSCPELKPARERMKSKENGEEITPQRSYTTIRAQETLADVRKQEEISRKRECGACVCTCVSVKTFTLKFIILGT